RGRLHGSCLTHQPGIGRRRQPEESGKSFAAAPFHVTLDGRSPHSWGEVRKVFEASVEVSEAGTRGPAGRGQSSRAHPERESRGGDGRWAGKRSTISYAARGNSQLLQAAKMYACSGLGIPTSPTAPEIRRRATAEQIKT